MVVFLSPQSALATSGPCKGDAFARFQNVAGGTISFRLGTVNDNTVGCTDRLTWTLDAGDSITLIYHRFVTGGVDAPDVPDKVTIDVLSDNGDTVIRTFLAAGAEPADGTQYILFATSDGTNLGTPKAGMFRIRVRGVKDSGIGGVGNYDVTSDSDAGSGGTVNGRGGIRAGIKVSDITQTYPAGSTYAYGPAGDETMTFTSATTDRIEDTGANQTVRVNTHRNGAAVGTDILQGTTGEFLTAGNAQSDICDNTYDAALGTSYDTEYEIVGNSNLLTAQKWTHIAAVGHGADITPNDEVFATYANRFSCDPRLNFSTDGTTANNNVNTASSIYNRGETATFNFYLLNSRTEKLSRAMTVSVIASDTSTEDGPTSRAPTANLYSASYAIGSTHLATNDTTGSAKKFRATNTDQTKDSNNAHSVSSLIRLGTTSGSTNGSVNVAVSPAVYNRGETVSGLNFFLTNARGEVYASKVATVAVRADDSTVEDSQSLTSDGTGKITFADYVVASTDKAVADDTGSLKHIRVTPPDGNTAFSSNNAHGVSSKYYVDAHPQLNNSTVSKDDFPNEDANETFTGIIAADTFNFFAHVKNVRKVAEIDTSANTVEFTVKRPDGTTRTTNQTFDTGADGWTSNFDFSLEAPAGSWTITASTTFNGNSGTDTETLTFVSPYTGNYQLEAVGWNQTYDIGNTARFTIRTLQRNSSGTFVATAADSPPSYTLRYWDGATWQPDLASGSMTALDATATYETTYAIPNESAWSGRKIAVSFSAVMSGTRVNASREIEIVSSPAQVVINSITDTTVPTISASVRITNEGNADNFDYTYEYCVVVSDTNECGGGNDEAYGSASKRILAGQNFDTTLTLNVTDTGNYIFKVAVWWSNQSSKASRTFTATAAATPTPTPTPAPSSGGGGGGGGGGYTAPATTPTPSPSPLAGSLEDVWRRISDILIRILGLETRVNNLEARVAALERRTVAPAPRREISVPQPRPSAPKVEAPPSFFKIRLR